MEVDAREDAGRRRIVVLVVLGLGLGVLLTTGVWELEVRRGGARLDLNRYDAAMVRAPWLVAWYGTEAANADREGRVADALRGYDLVLSFLPGHPGTALARGEALVRSGRIAVPWMRERALRDLATAEAGWKWQLNLIGGPPEGSARPTQAALLQTQQLKRVVESGSGAAPEGR